VDSVEFEPYDRRRLWSAAECSEDGCTTPPVARNLCSRHYQRAKKEGRLPPTIRRAGRRHDFGEYQCSVEGCAQLAKARALCPAHYRRSLRYGLGLQELAEQDAKTACDACGGPAEHIDHDHATGDVRGKLCAGCNTALGLLGESVPRMVGLLAYLVRVTG
jgi:hypothetical protein